MTIHDVTTAQLAEIIAGLVREGLQFDVTPLDAGFWRIKLTGGF